MVATVAGVNSGSDTRAVVLVVHLVVLTRSVEYKGSHLLGAVDLATCRANTLRPRARSKRIVARIQHRGLNTRWQVRDTLLLLQEFLLLSSAVNNFTVLDLLVHRRLLNVSAVLRVSLIGMAQTAAAGTPVRHPLARFAPVALADNVNVLHLAHLNASIKLVLFLLSLSSVHEVIQSHFRFGNFNSGLCLFSFLGAAQLLGHNRLAGVLHFDFFGGVNLGLFDVGNLSNAETLGFLDTGLESLIVNLLVKRWVIATLSVDVVGQHSVTVVDTANGRICVAAAVSVERRLAKVSSESGISKPASRVEERAAAFLHFCGSFTLSFCHFDLGFVSPSRGATSARLLVLEDLHSFLFGRR